MRVITAVSYAVIILLLNCPPALAHGVHVFGYVEAGHIKGEGYFGRGSKAQNAAVELYDAAGKLLAATKTDTAGRFSFKLPSAKPPLKLVLKAGMGHQAEYVLKASDLGQAPAAPAAAAPAPPAVAAPPAISVQQLEQAVARALESQLAPINRRLAELSHKQGVSVQDVVAGIGYILGLFGIAAWLASRRKQG